MLRAAGAVASCPHAHLTIVGKGSGHSRLGWRGTRLSLGLIYRRREGTAARAGVLQTTLPNLPCVLLQPACAYCLACPCLHVAAHRV